MGYHAAPSVRPLRACGHDFYFSKIAFLLERIQEDRRISLVLQSKYAAWIGWLNALPTDQRTGFIDFILEYPDDCPTVLLSVDIWPDLKLAWDQFCGSQEGEAALMQELRLYDLLFPQATNASWCRHLRVLAGLEPEDGIRFFADMLVEMSQSVAWSDEDWNAVALHLLTKGKLRLSGTGKAPAMLEMRHFFARIAQRNSRTGVLLYHFCRKSIPELRENTNYQHWFFSRLMTLFGESKYAGTLCAKLSRPLESLAGTKWWYPYFQLWLSVEFPFFTRLLLPRQALGIFREFGQLSGEHIIRNLPVFVLKNLPELLRDHRQKQWIMHLAAGRNIRTARNLPFPLTKKMAHDFTQFDDAANCFDSLWLAFGWSCGARSELVGLFRRYWRLSDLRQHYAFLQSALRFAMQAGYTDEQLDAIAGYWRHAIHESRGKYTLHGRTPESVLRQAEQFYAETRRLVPGQKRLFWKAREDIKPYLQITEAGHWSIIELTSTTELLAEGQALQHCVGGYSSSCKQGRSSIWSLRLFDGITKTSLLTIQLDERNRIVQAKGHRNRLPCAPEMVIIRRWTEEQGIGICRC